VRSDEVTACLSETNSAPDQFALLRVCAGASTGVVSAYAEDATPLPPPGDSYAGDGFLIVSAIQMINWPDVIAGAAIGVLTAAAIAYAFYVLQLRSARGALAFMSTSWEALTRADQEISDLEVTFRGIAIPRLTRTRLALWNTGWSVVRGEDIAAVDPLRISFDDGDVLDARLIAMSRAATAVDLDTHDNACFVTLDFFDRGDGAVLELLHTAGPFELPRVDGTVRGVPGGAQNYGTLTTYRSSTGSAFHNSTTVHPIDSWPTVLLTVAATVGGAAGIVFAHRATQPTTVYLVGAGFVLLGLLLGQRTFARRLPSRLAEFRNRD
jgi:hypothetical protein